MENKNGLMNCKLLVPLLLAFFLLLLIFLIFSSKEGQIKMKIKSTLEKVIEKSDLETVTFTYNVIAKQCKDDEVCDKATNNINNFKYVVSCKGSIVAGIDFKKIAVDVNQKNKKVVIKIPEATIIDEPNILSIKFLNGNELPASELPNARRLCQETIKEKSSVDEKLIPAAKEQSIIVLEEFYNQWIKAYNSSYSIEVKWEVLLEWKNFLL